MPAGPRNILSLSKLVFTMFLILEAAAMSTAPPAFCVGLSFLLFRNSLSSSRTGLFCPPIFPNCSSLIFLYEGMQNSKIFIRRSIKLLFLHKSAKWAMRLFVLLGRLSRHTRVLFTAHYPSMKTADIQNRHSTLPLYTCIVVAGTHSSLSGLHNPT